MLSQGQGASSTTFGIKNHIQKIAVKRLAVVANNPRAAYAIARSIKNIPALAAQKRITELSPASHPRCNLNNSCLIGVLRRNRTWGEASAITGRKRNGHSRHGKKSTATPIL